MRFSKASLPSLLIFYQASIQQTLFFFTDASQITLNFVDKLETRGSGAERGKSARNGCADAAACSSDDGDLAGDQVCGVHTSQFLLARSWGAVRE